MEITIDLVDWVQVKDKADKGTLSDDLFDVEGGEDWIAKSKTWTNESFSVYCSISEVFENELNNLNDKTISQCNDSICCFLNETANMPKELGEALDPEYYVGTVSPETIRRSLSSLDDITLEELQKAMPKDVMEYINEWINTLQEASCNSRGLLIYIG